MDNPIFIHIAETRDMEGTVGIPISFQNLVATDIDPSHAYIQPNV